MCEVAEAVTEELRRHLSKSPPLSPQEFVYVRQKMCQGKVRFPSKSEAEKLQRHLERCHKDKHREKEMDPYHCLFCGGWHNGNRKHDGNYYKRLHKRIKATQAVA